MARLMDYETNGDIRQATGAEARDSELAARTDGGAGVIDVDGRRCYVPVEAERSAPSPAPRAER